MYRVMLARDCQPTQRVRIASLVIDLITHNENGTPKEMTAPMEAILGRRFQMCIDLGTHALLATEKHGGIRRGRLATEP
jgi:hypothetical protein